MGKLVLNVAHRICLELEKFVFTTKRGLMYPQRSLQQNKCIFDLQSRGNKNMDHVNKQSVYSHDSESVRQ